MPIQVLPAEDADMTRVFEIASRAFAVTKDKVWPVLWPEGSDVEAGGARMTKTKNSDPNTTYIKAVDDETGEILGMAKWNIWTKENIALSDKAEGLMGEYSSAEDREFAKALIPRFVADRNEAKVRTSGNLVSLDILTVDPAHQRKKVGDALVRWGTQRADELGFEAVVESSPFGKGLYEKHGFVWVKDVVVEAPEFPERQKGWYAWLVRPKQNVAQ